MKQWLALFVLFSFLSACGSDPTPPSPDVFQGCQEHSDCEDDNPCTFDQCYDPNIEDGCRNTPQVGVSCDDENLETSNDFCNDAAQCEGVPYTCEPTNDPCQISTTPNGIDCDVEMKPEGTACDDSNTFTKNDACSDDAQCVGTDYECLEENTCVASSTPNGHDCEIVYKELGDWCDDSDANTEIDVCDESGNCLGLSPCEPTQCESASALVGIACEVQYHGQGTPCEDNDPTTKQDICNGQGGCAGIAYQCTPTQCQSSSTPNGYDCDAINKPNTASCNDDNSWTKDDLCDGDGFCQGTPYQCGWLSQCAYWSVPDGTGCSPIYWPAQTPCSDGNFSTKDDICDKSGDCKGTLYECTPTQCEASSAQNGKDCTVEYKAAQVACDDENNSTKGDICDGMGGCQGTSLDCSPSQCEASSTGNGKECVVADKAAQVACDDGDLSTNNDACDGQGNCKGSTIGCEPTQCQATSAPDGAGCVVTNKPANMGCDDGDESTKDDLCDGQGNCKGTPYPCVASQCDFSSSPNGTDCTVLYKSTVTPCDDGSADTANDLCDGKGGCAGTLYTCSPKLCEQSSTSNGIDCDVVNTPTNTPCDDGNMNTKNDLCNGLGGCVGLPFTCTASQCVASSTGNGANCTVVFSADATACDDNNINTKDDLCNGQGTCTGTPYNCTASQCEQSSTPDGSGCKVINKPGFTPCNDVNDATKDDQCNGSGTCAGTPFGCVPGKCEATSVPDGDGCKVTYKPVDTPCDDWLSNTKEDACDKDGKCAGTAYECTANTCQASSVPNGSDCTITIAADGAACDDSNICTLEDSCKDGACSGSIMACDDNIACTFDGCDPANGCVNEVSDDLCDDAETCTDDSCDVAAKKCVHTPIAGECDDGTVCTTNDSCSAEGYCEGKIINCDDSNACTADTCNAVTGCYHSTIFNTSCDDEEICTLNDTCEKGECVGQWNKCDDGNPCTNDSCTSNVGCSNDNNQSSCDDQDGCTVDDLCKDGECAGTLEPCPPAAWHCDKWSFGTGDGCDCECGGNDPDCDFDPNVFAFSFAERCNGETQAVFATACNVRDRCVSATWVANGCDVNDYAEGAIFPDPSDPGEVKICPDEWAVGLPPCVDGFDITPPKCDCKCGVMDPDCYWKGPNNCAQVCPPGQPCINNFNCVNETGSCVANSCDLANWNPNCGEYNGGDGCDCGCGCYDPDCAASGNLVTVDAGTCQGNPIPNPANANNSEFSPTEVVCVGGEFCAPQAWLESEAQCDPAEWNTGVKVLTVGGLSLPIFPTCNCHCGAYDPDCNIDLVVASCPYENSSCDNEQGYCQIDGWACHPAYYDNNDGCHCECGIPDPDCVKEGSEGKGVVWCGQTNFDAAGIDGKKANQLGGGYANPMKCNPQDDRCYPASWSEEGCNGGTYNELADVTEWTEQMSKDWLAAGKPAYCDCECGAVDPDCHIVPHTIGDPVGYSDCPQETGEAGGSAVQQCGLTGPVAGKCFSAYDKEPTNWNGWDDGEVCNCGLYGNMQDPDCDKPGLPVSGCPEGYRCADGQCNNTWGRVKMLFIHGRRDGPPVVGFEYWKSGPACDDCPANPRCYPNSDAWCEATGACPDICECNWPGGCDAAKDKAGNELPGSAATLECCDGGDAGCMPVMQFNYPIFAWPFEKKDGKILLDTKTVSFYRYEMCDESFVRHAYMKQNPEAIAPMSKICGNCSNGASYLYKKPTAKDVKFYCSKDANSEVCKTLKKNQPPSWKANFKGGKITCLGKPKQVDCDIINIGVPEPTWSAGLKIRSLAHQCSHIRAQGCEGKIPLDDPWVGAGFQNMSSISDEESIVYNVAVNWDGQSRAEWALPIIEQALDKHCTGNSYCYLYTHSTGGLLAGYAIAEFGHLKQWNIVKVFQSASAEGGSELADYGMDGLWSSEYNNLCDSDQPAPGAPIPYYTYFGQKMFPIDCDLQVDGARDLYDHDATNGVPFAHAAGRYGSPDESKGIAEWLVDALTSLSDYNDGALSFHSSCGCNEAILNLCKDPDSPGCGGYCQNVPNNTCWKDLSKCSQCTQWVGHKWELEEGGFNYGHNKGMLRISHKAYSDKTGGPQLNTLQSLYTGPGPWERWKAQLNYVNKTLSSVPQDGSGPLILETENPSSDACGGDWLAPFWIPTSMCEAVVGNATWTECSWQEYLNGTGPTMCYVITPTGELLIPWHHAPEISSTEDDVTIEYYSAGFPGFATFETTDGTSVHIPGTEVCDCIDNDFDGVIDEGLDCSEAPACN